MPLDPAPPCPGCAKPMTVVRQIARGLSSIQKNAFECAPCDLILAEELARRLNWPK